MTEAGLPEGARPGGSGGRERRDGGGSDRLPELEPLPYDGVLSVTVGTAVWFVALVIMLPLAGRLNDDGHLWWLATAAVGFGLGLLGIRMTSRRRARLRASGQRPDGGG
jgi:hypothetical protein